MTNEHARSTIKNGRNYIFVPKFVPILARVECYLWVELSSNSGARFSSVFRMRVVSSGIRWA